VESEEDEAAIFSLLAWLDVRVSVKDEALDGWRMVCAREVAEEVMREGREGLEP
jgi:hypothetical protein